MNKFYQEAMALFNAPMARSKAKTTGKQNQVTQRLICSQEKILDQPEQQPQKNVSNITMQSLRSMIDNAQQKVYQIQEQFHLQHANDEVSSEFILALFARFFSQSNMQKEFLLNYSPKILATAYEIAIVQEILPFAKSLDFDLPQKYIAFLQTYKWLQPIARQHRDNERYYPKKKRLEREQYLFQPQLMNTSSKATIEFINKDLPDDEKIPENADFMTRLEAQNKVKQLHMQRLELAKKSLEESEIKSFKKLEYNRQLHRSQERFDQFLEKQPSFVKSKAPVEQLDDNCTFRPKINKRPRFANQPQPEIPGYEQSVQRRQRAYLSSVEEGNKDKDFELLRKRTQRAARGQMSQQLAEITNKAANSDYTVMRKKVQKQIKAKLPGIAKEIAISFYENDKIQVIFQNISKIFKLNQSQQNELHQILLKEFAQFDSSVGEQQKHRQLQYDQLLNKEPSKYCEQLLEQLQQQPVRLGAYSPIQPDENDQFFW